MSVPAKLASFAAVLALSFGVAYGAGAAVGPIGADDPVPAATSTTMPEHGGHP